MQLLYEQYLDNNDKWAAANDVYRKRFSPPFTQENV